MCIICYFYFETKMLLTAFIYKLYTTLNQYNHLYNAFLDKNINKLQSYSHIYQQIVHNYFKYINYQQSYFIISKD